MVGRPHPAVLHRVSSPRGGAALVLTNEWGEQSRGRLLPGQRFIADDWRNGMTGLIGDVRGNEIFWRNGDRWTR